MQIGWSQVSGTSTASVALKNGYNSVQVIPNSFFSSTGMARNRMNLMITLKPHLIFTGAFGLV